MRVSPIFWYLGSVPSCWGPMVATRKLRPLCRPQLREVPVRHWNNNQQVTANKLRWKKANMIHDGCTLHIFYMLFADICTHVHIHKEIIDWPSFLDDNCPEWFDWVVSLKLTFYTQWVPPLRRGCAGRVPLGAATRIGRGRTQGLPGRGGKIIRCWKGQGGLSLSKPEQWKNGMVIFQTQMGMFTSKHEAISLVEPRKLQDTQTYRLFIWKPKNYLPRSYSRLLTKDRGKRGQNLQGMHVAPLFSWRCWSMTPIPKATVHWCMQIVLGGKCMI